MAMRSGAETMPWWIASIPFAQRRPGSICSLDTAPLAAPMTRTALFVHGDRNGWR
jgi:hypothetical protein